jgi:hypothetical protein
MWREWAPKSAESENLLTFVRLKLFLSFLFFRSFYGTISPNDSGVFDAKLIITALLISVDSSQR